jgi:hypothetical protein
VGVGIFVMVVVVCRLSLCLCCSVCGLHCLSRRAPRENQPGRSLHTMGWFSSWRASTLCFPVWFCRALGNFGNALLAQGELKKALREELRLAVAEGEGEGQLSLQGAEARMR